MGYTMTMIFPDLYQFSSYVQPINLTFHQYLLNTAEPLLVHTGNVQQAKTLLPALTEQLAGKPLHYIFVSHFEADECGGLALIQEHFPHAIVLCSDVTARQLIGFGFDHELMVKAPGEKLVTSGYELEFFSYPAEMHLWEGLLMMENRRRIFFSADLMLRWGDAKGTLIDADWQTEVQAIGAEQIPDPEKRLEAQQTLAALSPKFVATGHGPCLKL
jgi:flavorubredoxin